jgi:phosphatidate cytidylyltransferase
VSNLSQRILVALVAIPLIVFFSMLGGFYFFGMVLFISSIALHECYRLATKKGASPQTTVGIIFGAVVVSLFMGEKLNLTPPATAQFVILSLMFVLSVMLIELFRNKGPALLNIATTLFGVFYVSLFFGSLVGLRELFVPWHFPVARYFGPDSPANAAQQVYDWGGMTVVTVFVSIWVCDTLAYFAGRFVGRHKLFERVSPNKTWEGASAGYVGAVATFLIAQNFFLPYMTVGSAFVCGSIVGIVGQMGDLAESLLKRDAGVKDSSALIPGHGGALDRFDSLLFVAPAVYLYLALIAWR